MLVEKDVPWQQTESLVEFAQDLPEEKKLVHYVEVDVRLEVDFEANVVTMVATKGKITTTHVEMKSIDCQSSQKGMVCNEEVASLELNSFRNNRMGQKFDDAKRKDCANTTIIYDRNLHS